VRQPTGEPGGATVNVAPGFIYLAGCARCRQRRPR
jgi:hypothetical protein